MNTVELILLGVACTCLVVAAGVLAWKLYTGHGPAWLSWLLQTKGIMADNNTNNGIEMGEQNDAPFVAGPPSPQICSFVFVDGEYYFIFDGVRVMLFGGSGTPMVAKVKN